MELYHIFFDLKGGNVKKFDFSLFLKKKNMPGEGVEPSRLAASDFKSDASAIPPPGHVVFLLNIRHLTGGNPQFEADGVFRRNIH